jgi:hypothetical protein
MRFCIPSNPREGKGGYMFLKMDMEKAFDRMEWNFLLAILEKLGWPTWISWIKICISISSFSILLNGSPYGVISPGRGLRQEMVLKCSQNSCSNKKEMVPYKVCG